MPVSPSTKKYEVPDVFKDFLIYEFGTEDPKSILIFRQQTLLEMFETTQHLWLADGTFKVCPEFFFELFTIHTLINGYKQSSIHASVPNKCENTYERMLIAVKEKNPISSPTRVLVNFEEAVMNAFNKNFYQRKPIRV